MPPAPTPVAETTPNPARTNASGPSEQPATTARKRERDQSPWERLEAAKKKRRTLAEQQQQQQQQQQPQQQQSPPAHNTQYRYDR
jgi:hypothetical protein